VIATCLTHKVECVNTVGTACCECASSGVPTHDFPKRAPSHAAVALQCPGEGVRKLRSMGYRRRDLGSSGKSHLFGEFALSGGARCRTRFLFGGPLFDVEPHLLR
jgi:hypothetical protein